MKSRLLFCGIIVLFFINEMAVGQERSTNVVVTAVAPIYPRLARLTKTSGKMSIEVSVDKFGTVISATATKGEPNSYVSFRDVSERTARWWMFVASSEGADERKYVIAFIYRLMPDDTPDDELMPIYHYPFEMEVRNTAANPHRFEDPPVYHEK